MSDPRLRWQCRRGMLELDLLLEPFLAQGGAEGPYAHAFRRLLDEPDGQLYRWLVLAEPPTEPEYIDVIAAIRRATVA